MHVFVTVGTTRFDKLIQTVLAPQVLQRLKEKGYTSLTLQTGNSSFDRKGNVPIHLNWTRHGWSVLDIHDLDGKLCSNFCNYCPAWARTRKNFLRAQKIRTIICVLFRLQQHQALLRKRKMLNIHRQIQKTVPFILCRGEINQNLRQVLEQVHHSNNDLHSNLNIAYTYDQLAPWGT